MEPEVVGTLDGQPVYAMSGGGAGLRQSSLVQGEDVVVPLSTWAEALDVWWSTLWYRLRRGMSILDALDPNSHYARQPAHLLRFEHDSEAQRFVEEHPEGASLEEISEALKLDPATVRLAELRGLQELKGSLTQMKITSSFVQLPPSNSVGDLMAWGRCFSAYTDTEKTETGTPAEDP